MADPGASGGDGAPSEAVLKFVFANYDGVVVEQTFSRSALVSDVKTRLLEAWPDKISANNGGRKPEPEGIRLISGASGILDSQKNAGRVPHRRGGADDARERVFFAARRNVQRNSSEHRQGRPKEARGQRRGRVLCYPLAKDTTRVAGKTRAFFFCACALSIQPES